MAPYKRNPNQTFLDRPKIPGRVEDLAKPALAEIRAGTRTKVSSTRPVIGVTGEGLYPIGIVTEFTPEQQAVAWYERFRASNPGDRNSLRAFSDFVFNSVTNRKISQAKGMLLGRGVEYPSGLRQSGTVNVPGATAGVKRALLLYDMGAYGPEKAQKRAGELDRRIAEATRQIERIDGKRVRTEGDRRDRSEAVRSIGNYLRELDQVREALNRAGPYLAVGERKKPAEPKQPTLRQVQLALLHAKMQLGSQAEDRLLSALAKELGVKEAK